MNLSSEIEKHLINLNSQISLRRTPDKAWTENNAFAQMKKRFTSVYFYNQSIAILFSENKACRARCLTSETLIIAHLINQWLGFNCSVEDLKNVDNGIEIFQNFKKRSCLNRKHQKKWNDLKNLLFRDEFSNINLKSNLTLEILERSYNDPVLISLYPYPSLNRICFSDFEDGFKNYLCIGPCHWEHVKEKYYVNIPPNSKQIFENDLSQCIEIIKENINKLDEPNNDSVAVREFIETFKRENKL